MTYAAWEPGDRAAGDDEAAVTRLVHTFYGKVRQHPDLGPIFNTTIGDRWDEHLATLVDFWMTMGLGVRRYDGRPLPPHLKLPDLGPAHFAAWLVLFRETARETLTEATAERFIARAETIARSFQYAIDVHRDSSI